MRLKRHFIRVHRKILFRLLPAASFLAAALNLSAQGTAFMYQGRLNDAGAPANTNYDFRFTVYDAVTNGNRASLSLTNFAVPVANGLFTVTLDFGSGVFTGSNYWLDIGVRANGTVNFTALVPRQPILPVPYAIFATSASNLLGGLQSTQLVGRISSTLISGTYSNGVNFSNGTNAFAGYFSGNGSNLTSLNASQITSGTLADARLTANVALLNTNQTFTGTNTFTGRGIFSGANAFSGINTFTNNGNYFQGSFFGNGLVGWLAVNATSTNAMRDAGYLMLSSSQAGVTLPPTASLLVGDIVRVSGGGTGGWLVKVNSGQSITGNFAACVSATLVELASAGYNGVAISGDGARIYVVGGGSASAYGFTGVYASSDGGNSFAQVGATYVSGYCSSIACSVNGKIVYVEQNDGTVKKSTDGGATWAAYGSAPVNNFISCTSDGSVGILTGNVACSGNGVNRAKLSGGAITVSQNSGSSFPIAVPAPASGVTCLAASSDCARLVAGVSNGLLYATSNLGASWTALTATNQNWSSVAMSADGGRIAATVGSTATTTGKVYSGLFSALPYTTTSAYPNGSISGGQGCAVELQFIGGNQFIPVSSSGLIWAN